MAPFLNNYGAVIYMPSIRVKDHEPFDSALRRFKRLCEKAGIMTEVRRHEFYEKPTWKRKRKAAAAKKRLMKRVFKDHGHAGARSTKRATSTTADRDK